MIVSGVSEPPSKAPLHWPSLLQMVLSALFVILLFAVAGFIALTGVMQYLSSGSAGPQLTQSFLMAGSLAFIGALVVPSAWYSWKRLAHPDVRPVSKPLPRRFGLTLTIITLVGTGLALLIGNFVAGNDQIAWLILPVLNIIATGLPALWVIYFGARGLLPDSPQRKWGVFSAGLVLGPLLILFIELILLVGVGILAILFIMADPSLAPQLNALVTRLQSMSGNPEAIMNSLLPFLSNPAVLFIGFSYVAVLVPLIEETIKPIGVWFMAGQKITPAQGFGFGVLSGAGFGLAENLGNTSSAVGGWALLAGSRISTLFLHSFTAGLVGWALASAWSERRFLRLAISFTIAVLIHGLWNGMAVISVAASLNSEVPSVHMPAWLVPLSTLATLGVIFLGIVVLISFFGFNKYLRQELAKSAPPPAGWDAPLPPSTPTTPQGSSLDDSLSSESSLSSSINPGEWAPLSSTGPNFANQDSTQDPAQESDIDI